MAGIGAQPSKNPNNPYIALESRTTEGNPERRSLRVFPAGSVRVVHGPRGERVMFFRAIQSVVALAAGLVLIAQDRDILVKKLAEELSLLDAKDTLYAFNSDFVLQPAFDSTGRLTAVRVVPKYFFEDAHPEWKEPEVMPVIRTTEYRNALERLARIAPIGVLVARGDVGITTNLRTRLWDRHADAMIERTMAPLTGNNGTESVASFVVLYFRPVSGIVEAKERSLPDNYILRIDGTNYWTDKDTFDTAVVGNRVTIRGASRPRNAW